MRRQRSKVRILPDIECKKSTENLLFKEEKKMKRVIDCENTGCLQDNNVNSTTCGEPIYYSSETFDGVSIRKKKCNPEVAIVTKIECESQDRYKLHVSREYHEHNRTWLEKITIGEGEDQELTDVGVHARHPVQQGDQQKRTIPHGGIDDEPRDEVRANGIGTGEVLTHNNRPIQGKTHHHR